MNKNIDCVKSERRQKPRRACKDRRMAVRFGNALGRRSGCERRSNAAKH